ncbi:MAG: hypothetical protein WA418_23070, partial [Bradyrhizobium sp.]
LRSRAEPLPARGEGCAAARGAAVDCPDLRKSTISEPLPPWLANLDPRFVRPDWKKWLRPEWQTWMPPGTRYDKPAPRSKFARLYKPYRDEPSPPPERRATGLTEADILFFRSNLAALRFKLALLKWRIKAGFNSNQPRVPAGNPDGGKWTDGTGGIGTRFAASDKPRLGPAGRAVLAAQVARRLIDVYRSANSLRDLFGRKDGTVMVTEINGENVFGSNSTSPSYADTDYAAATRMRDTLLQKYPEVMDTENIGRRPNDALYHAETTVLLRAAEKNGGTLAGQTLEVFGDRPLCSSCKRIVPLIGMELGNPVVTFVNPSGLRETKHNGAWLR